MAIRYRDIPQSYGSVAGSGPSGETQKCYRDVPQTEGPRDKHITYSGTDSGERVPAEARDIRRAEESIKEYIRESIVEPLCLHKEGVMPENLRWEKPLSFKTRVFRIRVLSLGIAAALATLCLAGSIVTDRIPSLPHWTLLAAVGFPLLGVAIASAIALLQGDAHDKED
jgi:hypothetical protein